MLRLASSPSGDKPTVVLVHGAFAESSSWNGVIDRLVADGFPVVAAAVPLRGVQVDSENLAGVLGQIDGPVVLAGHSYGGVVISHAAEATRTSARSSSSAATRWRSARTPRG
jgi:pimeloyl-ACP methyl ester carboxylesterase